MSAESSPISFSSSSQVASSAADDGDEYSNAELQFIWDTVLRAEATLPQLPPTSRLPTTALFRAYGELLEERNIEPINGAKLDKLLFKIGGCREGKNIAEKFQAVMARMNITVRLDIDQLDDENLSHRSDQSDRSAFSDDESLHLGLRAQQRLLPHFDKNLAHDAQPHRYEEFENGSSEDALWSGASLGEYLVKHESVGREGSDHDGPTQERVLLKSAAAFQQYCERIHALQDVQDWQDKASALEIKVKLFADAAEEDFRINFRDVLIAWDEIAVEVDEMPLDDLPANVYSKRIERIAIRTDEIKVTKNAVARWSHRIQQQDQSRIHEISQEEEDELFQDDVKLIRLAQRTHEILSKSAAIAQWSNRATGEIEKAEVARKADEMSLKARVLGMKPKPSLLAGLAQRLKEKVAAASGTNLRFDISQAPIPSQAEKVKTSEGCCPGHEQPMGISRQALVHQPEKLNISAERILIPPDIQSSLAKSTTAEPTKLHNHEKAPAAELDDELDERTLLAKRHLTRMKFFNAWADYTEGHTSKVKIFAKGKAVGSWRGQAAKRSSLQADDYHKEWHHLARWRQSDRQTIMRTKALNFNKTRRLRGALADWRAETAMMKHCQSELHGIADFVGRFQRTHVTMQQWKARSRETSLQTSMKSDVLQTWRGGFMGAHDRAAQMGYMSHRVKLYRIKAKVSPAWHQAAKVTAMKDDQMQTYAECANFYSMATAAIHHLRSAAKEKRRARLREAYLEIRRRVKRRMGARCIAQWHDAMKARHEHLQTTGDDFAQYQSLNAKARVTDIWRLRAREKVEAKGTHGVEEVRGRLDEWRVLGEDRRQIQDEAEVRGQDRAGLKRIKEWKLGSLQIESRQTASGRHLNRDRKRAKQSLEIWAAKVQVGPAGEEEPSTPGRPRLFMGGLQGASTTPLAPIPQRDSLLGGRASRSTRSRRNLRVSWAE